MRGGGRGGGGGSTKVTVNSQHYHTNPVAPLQRCLVLTVEIRLYKGSHYEVAVCTTSDVMWRASGRRAASSQPDIGRGLRLR